MCIVAQNNRSTHERVCVCIYCGTTFVPDSIMMNHFHSMLIDDSQWVAHCVESQCSFINTGYEYVCPWHKAVHRCNNHETCLLVNNMSIDTCTRDDDRGECRVAKSASFRAPEVEYGCAYYVPNTDNAADGYGSVHVTRGVVTQNHDMEARVPIIKTAVPVILALFATMESKEFKHDYQRVARNKSTWHCPHGTGQSPWTNAVIALTKFFMNASPPTTSSFSFSASVLNAMKDMASRSAVALSTLFDSPFNIIVRFMRKVTCKYHDLETSELEFYVLIIMAALCTFPYLRHDMCDVLDVKILVVMCFDKTVTKHDQWSRLSTYVHQHANRPDFIKRIDNAAHLWLPTIIRKTIDDYIMKLPTTQSTSQEEQQPLVKTPSDFGTPCVCSPPSHVDGVQPRKRRPIADNVITDYNELADNVKRVKTTTRLCK